MEKKLPIPVVNWLVSPGGTRRRIAKHTLTICELEMTMKDFARVPTGHQAIRLNWFEARLRRLCYCLAQKGDPEVNA
ncbi:hypothetical protein BL127_00017710 [Raoultella planticola]|nr:hypothetical protein BL127_00017710 [Raoultella planticola]